MMQKFQTFVHCKMVQLLEKVKTLFEKDEKGVYKDPGGLHLQKGASIDTTLPWMAVRASTKEEDSCRWQPAGWPLVTQGYPSDA